MSTFIYESYARSAEVAVTAEKKPSSFVGPNLINEAGASVIDSRQPVGTKIRIWGKLVEDISPYPGLPGRTVIIMRKVGAGAYAELARLTTDSGGYLPTYWYTLIDPGINTFQLVFEGDAYYAGCARSAKAFAR